MGPKFAGLQSRASGFEEEGSKVPVMVKGSFPPSQGKHEQGRSREGSRGGSQAARATRLLATLRKTSLICPQGQAPGEVGHAVSGVPVYRSRGHALPVRKPRRHSQELGKRQDLHRHVKKRRNMISVCGRVPLIALLLLSSCCIRVALML